MGTHFDGYVCINDIYILLLVLGCEYTLLRKHLIQTYMILKWGSFDKSIIKSTQKKHIYMSAILISKPNFNSKALTLCI